MIGYNAIGEQVICKIFTVSQNITLQITYWFQRLKKNPKHVPLQWSNLMDNTLGFIYNFLHTPVYFYIVDALTSMAWH